MPLFESVSEKDVTRAIVSGFMKQFEAYAESDCVIVGAGPSGLMAGRELCRAGVKTLIVERNNYLGGGFWIGGYLMNKVTIRKPADKVLDELGIPWELASLFEAVRDCPFPEPATPLIVPATSFP